MKHKPMNETVMRSGSSEVARASVLMQGCTDDATIQGYLENQFANQCAIAALNLALMQMPDEIELKELLIGAWREGMRSFLQSHCDQIRAFHEANEQQAKELKWETPNETEARYARLLSVAEQRVRTALGLTSESLYPLSQSSGGATQPSD